ncbi:MAG: NAD(P)-binding domain-containing protein [Mycobacteriales bacterium]
MKGSTRIDVLIIGAGPGGIQVAHELHQARSDYLVVEAADGPGDFFNRFPRHRQLISVNKCAVALQDNSLRFDWNSLLSDDDRLQFARYSQDYWPEANDMVRYLTDFVVRQQLHIRYNARVRSIETAPSGEFTVTLNNADTLTARRVVVATGMAPYVPAIPGIEHADSYENMSIDPNEFANLRVLIIGKGNSAFETADLLMPVAHAIHMASPNTVKLAWNSHYVGNLRAINNGLIDTYQLKIGNALLDAEITEIRCDAKGFHVDLAYTHAGGHRVTYHYDRVIAATGFRFAAQDIFSKLNVETSHDARFPAMTSSYQSPRNPGLYFAGTVTHSRDYRKTMSGFIHGFRYNARFLARLLISNGRLSPDQALSADAKKLAEWALDRINTSDAIYLQPGYYADVAIEDGECMNAYLGVPLDWVREGGLGNGWQVAVTLAYGPPAPDPLRVERSPDLSYAAVTPFLHPVLHLRRNGRDAGVLHLLEDLENRYAPDDYLPQLVKFFQTALTHETVVS